MLLNSILNKFPHLPSKRVIHNMILSFFVEFSPLFVFVYSYKYLHIYKATFLLMIATIIATFFSYVKQKRIPYVGLYVALLTIIFGYITIAYHVPKFIQIKDTIYDITFALTLIVALMFKKNILHFTLNSSIPMAKEAWVKITYGWIFWFTLCAVLNEFVRRNFEIGTWVTYKTSIFFFSIIFGLVSGVIFYQKEKDK